MLLDVSSYRKTTLILKISLTVTILVKWLFFEAVECLRVEGVLQDTKDKFIEC